MPLTVCQEGAKPSSLYFWWLRDVIRLSLADEVFLPRSPCRWDHLFSREPEDTERVAVGIQMASGTGPGW